MFSLKRLVSVLPFAVLALAPERAFAGATASSYAQIPGQPVTQYSPLNAIDGDPRTVWMEGVDGAGDGSWIKVDLPRGTVQKIRISGGHLLDERMFQKYSRAKDITLEFFSTDDNRILQPIKQINHTLQDKHGLQEIDVGNINIGGELFGGEVKITIKTTYPGKDYRDTVMSEIQIQLEEYPAQCSVEQVSSTRSKAPVVDPTAKKQEEIKYKEGTDVNVDIKTDEKAADTVFDGNPKTSWVTEGPGAGQFILIEVPDYGMSSMVITLPNEPGVARPKKVTLEVGSARFEATLKDDSTPQRVDFPMTNGYNGGHFGRCRITIDSVHGPNDKAPSGISEIRIWATNYSV